jgi:hypothetical protein
MINQDIYKTTVDNIIYGSYVKNDRLDVIVSEAFSNTSIASATELNIFIDVYSVLHQAFSEHYRVEYTNYTDITSCIINMCAHYRAFFRRLRVHTKFFLVFSTNTCDINRKFIAGYNDVFLSKCSVPEYKKVATDNFNMLKVLCMYLPDIYFVHSLRGYETSVIMAHLIRNVIKDGNPNMIISKDLYPLQLTTMFPYTTFLYPRKKKLEGDVSILVPVNEKYTFRQAFWSVILETRKLSIDNLMSLSPINYSLINAISMFSDRNVKALYNMRIAREIITKLVGSDDIKIDISLMKQSPDIANKYDINQIENRYKALDVSVMLPWYMADPEASQIKLVNLRDDEKINQINAKYFERNPIDLLRL